MRQIDLSRSFDKFSKTNRGTGLRRDAVKNWVSAACKYVLDASFAAIGLLVLSPMILMVMAILLVLQGRPIFIAHRRIGKNGVVFRCLKFRTMVKDADAVLARHLANNPHFEQEWNATRKLRNDPRVTPFGALLRKSSIDEIPQLLNVVQGRMSLVGPRPIVASEVELYGTHFADYIRVRPGLTGLWQISGRSDTSYRERVQLDVRYVRENTLGGDLAIMIKTIPAILRSRGCY
ncbi:MULTISPECIES: sugar transferase [unclassified Rhizobium]|uniref:sugar transferase n=1 Tax=unclassified Rhizobium TaxID=2613769 RepID=UPI000B52992F|nr:MULTISPECIES: sugar transferase [unclassified Rhizobium]